MLRRVALVVAAVATMLALVGCASIPTEELNTYASAFQETRAAGYILLDKVVPAVEEAEKASGRGLKANPCSPDPTTGAPKCLDLTLITMNGRPVEPRSIMARRVALDLIATYNSILVDLASGKSVTEVQSRVTQLSDLLSEFITITGIGAAVPAIGAFPVISAATKGQLLDLVARFERARVAVVSRESILEAQGSIHALLNLLEADAPDLYSFYYHQRRRDYFAALRHNPSAAPAIAQDIKEFYASVMAYVVLIRKTSQAYDTLTAAAAAGPTASPEQLLELVKEGEAIRTEAKSFWQTVRKVGEAKSAS